MELTISGTIEKSAYIVDRSLNPFLNVERVLEEQLLNQIWIKFLAAFPLARYL